MSGISRTRPTDEELNALFSQAGAVDNVRVMRDMATGRARGFAFVEMVNDDGAQKAITQFHGQPLEGRPLVVNEARPKPEGGGVLPARRHAGTTGRTARTSLVAHCRSSPNLTVGAARYARSALRSQS